MDRRALWSLGLVAAVACGGGGDDELGLGVEEAGPYAVGNATFTVVDGARERTLTVEVWYPAAEDARAIAAAGESVAGFVVDPDDRATYVELLAAAPAGCPSERTQGARDAAISDEHGAWPVVAFSHCHDCVRFSAFSIAERLASHGFVVVAPDHAGNTLFDDLAGMGAELDEAFLQVRAADVRFVLDVVLDPGASEVPAVVRGRLDADRVGVFGHSFGATTAGLVAQDDGRPRAAFAIAAPMDNALLPGVDIAALDVPLGFLVAVEDNSITEIGNVFIRRNFEDAQVPAYKYEVADAGHWSFSDICGVHEYFAACCGAGERQTDLTPFEYLPIATGIDIGQAYVTAFFRAELAGDAGARRYLEQARPPELVSAEWHE